jgi:hypothetical protein
VLGLQGSSALSLNFLERNFTSGRDAHSFVGPIVMLPERKPSRQDCSISSALPPILRSSLQLENNTSAPRRYEVAFQGEQRAVGKFLSFRSAMQEHNPNRVPSSRGRTILYALLESCNKLTISRAHSIYSSGAHTGLLCQERFKVQPEAVSKADILRHNSINSNIGSITPSPRSEKQPLRRRRTVSTLLIIVL